LLDKSLVNVSKASRLSFDLDRCSSLRQALLGLVGFRQGFPVLESCAKTWASAYTTATTLRPHD